MSPKRTKRSVTGWIAVCLLAGVSHPAIAKQDPESAAAPGRVEFTSDVVNQQISAKDKPAMVAKGKAAGSLVVSTPALSNPVGMAVNWSVRVGFQQDGMPASDPFPVKGSVLLRKIDIKDGSKPDSQGRYSGAGEGPTLKFTVNDPFAFYSGNIEGMNPATGSFDLPVAASWNDGVMHFNSNSETILVVGRPDRAPFRHVTREEFIADLMTELYPDGTDPYSKPSKGLSALKAELAEMSPAERNSPACRGGKERPNRWLTSCSDAGSHYKVKMNHAYFDKSKSRVSTQLVTFKVHDAWVGEDVEEGDRLRAAFGQINVDAVRSLLD